MSRPATREALLRLLRPVVLDAGLDLEDVEVTPAGRRRVVRVVVDRDGGVDLDDVAAVSTAVSAVLDADADAEAALGGSPFVLEVSSPGVDRPLTEERHWRRARGRLVTAARRDGGSVTGRVVAVEAGTVLLTTEQGQTAVDLAELVRGRVQVEFRAADPALDSADGGAPDGATGPEDEEG